MNKIKHHIKIQGRESGRVFRLAGQALSLDVLNYKNSRKDPGDEFGRK